MSKHFATEQMFRASLFRHHRSDGGERCWPHQAENASEAAQKRYDKVGLAMNGEV
jgi:hypothetical protein